MTRYQITVDAEVLQGLFSRNEGMARLVEQVLNQVLAAQASEFLRAEPYDRTEERQGHRNGHRPRDMKCSVAKMGYQGRGVGREA